MTSAPTRLLLVEDDRVVRVTLRDALVDAGYQVDACADGNAGWAAAQRESFDIVLCDVRLPGLDGIALMRRLREADPGLAVVLMTAYADYKDAVEVMRAGARDYVVKPFEMEELLLRLGRVRRERELSAQMEQAARGPGAATGAIRGDSPATRLLLDRIDAAAVSDVSVLITGETGTGKEVCAHMIHQASHRAEKPFVAVNCAAIPENLLESELFGHEKGAFTGAERRREGRFGVADGGILFLDEVGELPVSQQAKLLRALESGTFEPVGSSTSRTVDVRILAATNRNLQEAVEAGTFRQDLFYRLNVVDIRMPPVRERRADIPALVAEILESIARRLGRAVPELDPGAVAALVTYDYPGNVRELIHALERAVALARGGGIRVEHLPRAMVVQGPAHELAVPTETGQVEPLGQAVERFEKEYIQRVLTKVEGHKGRAAQALGISRKSLWQRLKGPPDR
ncbi:MAG: sigma-54-dependent Fis family transcriptional regulator [Deltaproteobacteria bacterium]|nr:sigma-54-dependent Fis family transcriptional regulator [Deltaproteobacteria bacterium]